MCPGLNWILKVLVFELNWFYSTEDVCGLYRFNFFVWGGGGEDLDVGIRVCFSSLYVVLCLSFDPDFYTLSTAESIKIRL